MSKTKYLLVPYTPTDSSVASPSAPDDAVNIMEIMIGSVETEMAVFGKPRVIDETANKTISALMDALEEMQNRFELNIGLSKDDVAINRKANNALKMGNAFINAQASLDDETRPKPNQIMRDEDVSTKPESMDRYRELIEKAEKEAGRRCGLSDVLYDRTVQKSYAQILLSSPEVIKDELEAALRLRGYNPDGKTMQDTPEGTCSTTGIEDDYCPCGQHP